MKFQEVKSKLSENENFVATRTGWQIEKKVDKTSIESISEADRNSNDWVIRERMNE